jgi:cell division protein FtsN
MTQNYRFTRCQRGSTLLGLLIGLVLGIGIAAGVAIYVSHIPNPFAQSRDEGQHKPPPSSIATPDPVAAPKVSKAEPSKAAEGADNKGRFDFYKILPGEENATPGAAPAAKPAPASTGQTPAEPKPAAAEGTTYYLQAGAYQTEDDADNQKAKLALLGLEARVRAATVADKGTVYRVRLGPYANQEELNDAKTTLQDNGITASVIKIVKATGN